MTASEPSIPNDEQFARAKRKMREAFRGVDEVCAQVKSLFQRDGSLHALHLLPEDEDAYRLYIFLKRNSDIATAEASGLIERIVTATRKALQTARPSDTKPAILHVELDSDENVNKKFHGNYFNRLR